MKYETPITPRPDQVTALEHLVGKQYYALFMGMRKGKTKVVLDDFGRLELAGEVNTLVVIAPGGAYRTWEGAFAEHASKDLKRRATLLTWISKDTRNNDLMLKKFLASPFPRILIMNVEALSGVKRARTFLEAVLESGKAYLTIDESTCIKDPSAKRSKYIVYHLPYRTRFRRILSGLPTPRSPLDLFMQFFFLNRGIFPQRDFVTFRAHFATTIQKLFPNARFPTTVVTGYQNQEELSALIAPHSYIVPFRPNIPPTYEIREVEMTEPQKKAYNELKKLSTAELGDGRFVTATLVITKMLRLHQLLCGHLRDDETGKIIELPENRTAQLLELLEDYGGKAVIWCRYDYSIRKVVEALEKEYGEGSVMRFWGGNVATREDEERIFKTDPKARFMVATPAAGGKGRTWDNADLVIYHSSDYNLENRDQSEMRVQGVDKKRGVDYVDLIVPGTVEMVILKALREKMDLAAAITGDNWKEWLI
jgi:hypothetical protein